MLMLRILVIFLSLLFALPNQEYLPTNFNEENLEKKISVVDNFLNVNFSIYFLKSLANNKEATTFERWMNFTTTPMPLQTEPGTVVPPPRASASPEAAPHGGLSISNMCCKCTRNCPNGQKWQDCCLYGRNFKPEEDCCTTEPKIISLDTSEATIVNSVAHPTNELSNGSTPSEVQVRTVPQSVPASAPSGGESMSNKCCRCMKNCPNGFEWEACCIFNKINLKPEEGCCTAESTNVIIIQVLNKTNELFNVSVPMGGEAGPGPLPGPLGGGSISHKCCHCRRNCPNGIEWEACCLFGTKPKPEEDCCSSFEYE